ncbi:MAG: prephenate/arogenate dehydrogenase family protein [Robiginitomaculum sp.]|nr:prephenate/arogenate dehydrogenase family protein [Robiginitomaculum sp.]
MSEVIIYDEILIIGGGLIGSSIARAVREHGAARRVVMHDSDEGVCARLQALDICDHVDRVCSASQADLVILAVPPGVIAQTAEKILPHMKPGAMLSDVGSVKANVVEAITPLLPGGIDFIGGHPIAGTEQSGPDAGFASLFADRWCILTPSSKTVEDSPAAQKLQNFWQTLGSRVEFMDAAHHDLVLATTSHLPHLIAYALVGTATDMETVTKGEVVKYSAAGFRDFTRIAASDPVMWRDICLQNKDAVIDVLGRYIEDLTALKKAVRWGDGETLLKEFTKTRAIRDKIIDAGQDVAVPNFGRDAPEDGTGN